MIILSEELSASGMVLFCYFFLSFYILSTKYFIPSKGGPILCKYAHAFCEPFSILTSNPTAENSPIISLGDALQDNESRM